MFLFHNLKVFVLSIDWPDFPIKHVSPPPTPLQPCCNANGFPCFPSPNLILQGSKIEWSFPPPHPKWKHTPTFSSSNRSLRKLGLICETKGEKNHDRWGSPFQVNKTILLKASWSQNWTKNTSLKAKVEGRGNLCQGKNQPLGRGWIPRLNDDQPSKRVKGRDNRCGKVCRAVRQ